MIERSELVRRAAEIYLDRSKTKRERHRDLGELVNGMSVHDRIAFFELVSFTSNQIIREMAEAKFKR